MMWSVVRWGDTSISVEPSETIIRTGNITRIRWQEDGKVYGIRVLAVHG